jgi:hypothetical protein
VRGGDRGHPKGPGAIAQCGESPVVDEVEPGREQVVREHCHPVGPRLLLELGDGPDRSVRQQTAEGVCSPIDFGALIQQRPAASGAERWGANREKVPVRGRRSFRRGSGGYA